MKSSSNFLRKIPLWHALVWISGYVFFCLPGFALTIGVFSGEEGGLWLPAAYGTLFNAAIFYIHANYLLPTYLKQKALLKYLRYGSLVFFGFSFLESGLDYMLFNVRGYPAFEGFTEEIIITNLLLHGIFFWIPGYIYRFTLDWLVQQKPTETEEQNQPQEPNQLNVKSGGKLYPIKLRELYYIESQGNYLKLKVNEQEIKIRDSLQNFSQQLPPNDFIRCHKSFVVGIAHVQKLDYDFVYIGEEAIPIGRVYRQALKNAFEPKP